MDIPPPLTPNKIQRLMYFAQDKSYNTTKGGSSSIQKPSSTYESSLGLLDLDRCEELGGSDVGSISICKSTAFNPGEMTGRSTGADDFSTMSFGPARTFHEYGRFSVSEVQDYEKKLVQQSHEVKEIMRQSIASGYSFHSKRDLTADEASLVIREAPMPVPQSNINMNLKEMSLVPETDMSMGAYFKVRCQKFDEMLPRNDSPQYDISMGTSIAEDSLNMNRTRDIQVNQAKESTLSKKEPNNLFQMDMTLDSVPVRQPRVAKLNEKTVDKVTFVPISPPKENRPLMGPPASAIRPLAAKQTQFLLDPSRAHLSNSLRPLDNTFKSEDDESLSLSKIANILEKVSDVNVATHQMMKQMESHRRAHKHPLTEKNMNLQENLKLHPDIPVTLLKDSAKADTASSTGTVNTVIDLTNLRLGNQENYHKEMPYVGLTQPSQSETQFEVDGDVKAEQRATRSKSPSSRTRSTMSTVQENIGCTSFKSGDSPMQLSKGEKPNPDLSPFIEYKELEKSVDWDEVMQMKGRSHSGGFAKGPWAEIQTRPVKGFVGVSTPATISIRSLTDNWLTARLELHQQRNDITIDLPRFPLLLAPGRTEQCIVQVTSNVRTIFSLQFTIYLKDSSVDGEKEIEGAIEVDVQMPTIQAIASAGVNRVNYPLIPEGKSLTRSLVLVSDCSVDLQLELSVKEGASMFTINHVQEIKKSDITKEVIDHAAEKQKFKTKGLSKQLCKVTSGNAIKVSLTFAAPKMTQLNLNDTVATFSGCLDVNLIGINAVIKKIDLTASVGKPKLAVNILGQPTDKLHLGNEVANLTIANAGSVTGTWLVRFQDVSAAEQSSYPFRVSASQLEIEPGHTVNLKLAYTQPEDCITKGALIFEEVLTGNRTVLELTGGKDKGKPFPVKVNCAQLSWVRPGRKEISLKNTTDKKLHIKCRIMGEGFHIDCANAGVNSNMFVTIGGNECRPLPVVFQPSSLQPCRAALYMAVDKDSDNTRKVILLGCAGGEALRWCGMVTYGDTALVAAVSRQPVQLKLVNKSHAPAFVAARVHFNLQYHSVAAKSRLEEPHRVVPGKGSVTLTLHVDWARVERRARAAAAGLATALATVTVLTGAEYTRRRILKVLKQGSVGSLDVSLLPAHLQALVGPFAGEDPNLDHLLRDFDEAKTSLDELVGGVQELSAQIDLSQDFPEETTILITDDTVVDHHTLID